MKHRSNLIISTEEARVLLGDVAIRFSDDKIEKIIVLLDSIARETLQQVRSKIVSDERRSARAPKPKAD